MAISSNGMGVTLYQEIRGERKPRALALCTLMTAERNYVQIEKEFLTAVWTCKKFDWYTHKKQNKTKNMKIKNEK